MLRLLIVVAIFAFVGLIFDYRNGERLLPADPPRTQHVVVISPHPPARMHSEG
jgi:hypothetical protein